MNAKEIKLGTKLELELVGNDGKPLGYNYISQLLDILDERKIVIAYPIRESRLVFLPLGSRVKVILVDDKQNLISFGGVVKSKSNKGPIASILFEINTEFEKIQRRQFFRINCNLDAEYRIVPDNAPEKEKTPAEGENAAVPEEEPIEYTRCVTKDLSGSGVCILTAEEIPKGTEVEMALYLAQEVRVKVAGEVMRCWKDELAYNKYRVGLHFTSISRADQELIIKFMFDLQRELLKRGFRN